MWLTVPIEDDDRRFKVDLASYGVLEEGQEHSLTDPYELGLWPGGAPSVTMMRLEEIAAEKTLGWCARRLGGGSVGDRQPMACWRRARSIRLRTPTSWAYGQEELPRSRHS